MPTERVARRSLDALCGGLAVAWIAAWGYGIAHRYFDYDEFQHFYALWRIHGGARPFNDFFEMHPPFLWYALAPFTSVLARFSLPLFPLRILSALGELALLGALAKNVSLSMERLPGAVEYSWRVFLVATIAIAGHLSVTWYLLEFRLDAWPDALLLWAIWRDRRDGRAPFRSPFEYALLSTLMLLCAPKLAALFVLYAAFSVARADRRRLRAAGLAAGLLVALLMSGLFLIAVGIDPIVVYRMAVTYHVLIGARGGFGHGLARSLWAQPQLLALVFSGVLGWLLVARTRLAAFPFELAVCVFLVLQAALVPLGYPQYYGPWFLLGIVFLPYLETALRRVPLAHHGLVAAGLLLAGANVARDLQTFTGVNQTAPTVAFNRWASAIVPPEAVVVGDFMHIPLCRRGAFYHLAGTSTPNGYQVESALEEMHLPAIGARMGPQAYDEELESGRPALIAPGPLLSSAQLRSIDRYLARHRAEFRTVDSPEGAVWLRSELGHREPIPPGICAPSPFAVR
ncbi:MAG TPA: hypothetical protein VLC06_26105 [Polyangia bacterium]|nr:hypothetical protein [Polyangia bacterium]